LNIINEGLSILQYVDDTTLLWTIILNRQQT
jgi:hypothetical protein